MTLYTSVFLILQPVCLLGWSNTLPAGGTVLHSTHFSLAALLSAGGAPCCWGRGMSLCGRKALTLLSSVFAVCALGLLGIAVSTDYWLHLEEGVILPINQTTEMHMSLHCGLWRVCFLAGEWSRRSTQSPLSVCSFPAGCWFACCLCCLWLCSSSRLSLQLL